jgi:signal transduction histidine kinase
MVAVPASATTSTVITGSWSMVAAALSRVQWILVRRGGRLADRQLAEAEQAATAQLVADAVRADEQRLANALHDTAATTLLMVGVGQAGEANDSGLLAAQAARDLAVLQTYGASMPANSDLMVLLRAVADLVTIRVDFKGAVRLVLPAAVARAVADATGEALNNVVRHAMVDRAVVRVTGGSRDVQVEIVDAGCGFAPEEIPSTRRGVRESLAGRMRDVGGEAHVDSAVGSGTRVRLEWSE